jgi:queuosine precursor transporter
MNELLLLGFIFVDLILLLILLRLFGKIGVMLFYVLNVILSQIIIKMQIEIFGFTMILGSALFSMLFISSDVISEHYGRNDAYKMIKLGVISLLFFLFVVQMTLLFVPSSSNTVFESFKNLFSGQWRIIFADIIISYFVFQIFNAWFFNKLRKITKEKYLWLRTNLSAWICHTFVAVLFFQAAFAGVIPQNILWQIIIVGLIVKIILVVVETPVIYLSYKFLPKEENKNK